MESVNSWLGHWQYIWFFLILAAELLVSIGTLIVCLIMNKHEKLGVEWLEREFEYDAQKDQKKRRPKVASNNVEGSNVSNQREGEDKGREEGKDS